LREGVRGVGLSVYGGMHTRTCRPAGLTPQSAGKQLTRATPGRAGQHKPGLH
jgi:hypothetical protein